jgi:hypothetical protein
MKLQTNAVRPPRTAPRISDLSMDSSKDLLGPTGGNVSGV